MKVAINTHKNKHPKELDKPGNEQRKALWFKNYNGQFANVETTPAGLIKHVQKGYGIAPVLSGYRKRANFKQAWHTGLDFDDLPPGYTMQQLVSDYPFIAAHAYAVHTTASHTIERPRFRVLFCLDRPVCNVDKYQLLNRAMLARYPMADAACKDAARLFFGAENCDVLELGNTLTLETAAAEIVNPYKATQEPTQKAILPIVGTSTAIPDYFLNACVNHVLNDVRTAPDGQKWYTLNKAAYTIGGYVGMGYLSAHDAAARLENAIVSNPSQVKSLPHARRTIDAALADGQAHPLPIEYKPVSQPTPATAVAENQPKSYPTAGEFIAQQIAEYEQFLQAVEAGHPAWAAIAGEYVALQNAL